MWPQRLPSYLLTIGIVTGVVGCAASTKIVNEWTNPDYHSPRFTRVVVLAVSRQPSIRRAFEDAFVTDLKAAAVNALPSYRYIPEDGQVVEARMTEAVKRSGADAAIITRLVRVEKKTEVTPGFYEPAPALTFGFYPGYSAAWLGHYEPPTIYQRDIYISETSLYHLTENQLVWSGTIQTVDPSNINEEIKRYARTVIDALKNKNLLPSK